MKFKFDFQQTQWWEYLWLWLFRTHFATEGNVTIRFKIVKGNFYITGIDTYKEKLVKV